MSRSKLTELIIREFSYWEFPNLVVCNFYAEALFCALLLRSLRKTAEKGAERVRVKQPKNSRKNSRNTRKTIKTAVFRVFRLVFRLFFGCLARTLSAPLSAVFRLFSMSGIWQLCRWPQRSQLFCALLRSFALFCGLTFALFCAHLRVPLNDRVLNDCIWKLQIIGWFIAGFLSRISI